MKGINKLLISGLLSYSVFAMLRLTQKERMRKNMVILAEEALGDEWESLKDEYELHVEDADTHTIKDELKNFVYCLVPGFGWGAVAVLAFVLFANEDCVKSFGNMIFRLINFFENSKKSEFEEESMFVNEDNLEGVGNDAD